SKFADGQKIRYLNINDKLADSDGMLRDGMMNAEDKLHPTVEAYQVWADALKPVLMKLRGPTAVMDLAPPPTGDPAAGVDLRPTPRGFMRTSTILATALMTLPESGFTHGHCPPAENRSSFLETVLV